MQRQCQLPRNAPREQPVRTPTHQFETAVEVLDDRGATVDPVAANGVDEVVHLPQLMCGAIAQEIEEPVGLARAHAEVDV